MTDDDQDSERSTADWSHPPRPAVTESEKFFEAERLEESRKRFATYSLWAGLLSLLLLLIPNPFPWLFGPVTILLGIHALARIFLQPTRHAGTFRAVVGIIMGLAATLVAVRS